ncbi:importin-8-like [Paramacrobiotus metropolitanus]|uniref:importin-8-like n=1 Tax=Paramacrobiotus metropolitanus TaxID=2943436 RepID=UPI00244601B4|nr:importin-8-like [Paramacrobiotus metropolitanus]
MVAMDLQNLANLFAATLDPASRSAAEQQLESMKKVISFGPLILQHIRSHGDLPSRQAAAIYLKNYISHNWDDPTEIQIERAREKGEPAPFSIHEQDRAVLRDGVLEATIECAEVLRTQMAVSLETICKSDFPDKWTTIVQRVNFCLHSPQHELWYGALIALYHLVRAFEYKTNEECKAIDEAMKFLHPLLLQRVRELIPDLSEASYSLIKVCLKIFYSYTQIDFPKDVLTFEATEKWIDTIRHVIDAPVPPKVDELEEDERMDTIWWKSKKWALHICTKIFDRYGTPGEVRKEYNGFAKFFVGRLAKDILQSVFQLLDRKIQGHYVSNRCLQLGLTYIRQALKVPSCWKLIKPHAHDLLSRIVFPLMCFTEQDTELWQDDPVDWILSRTDIHMEYMSAESAASYLLHTMCRKHPNLLTDILNFTFAALGSDKSSPNDKDGALHFFGVMGRTLMKRKPYKDSVESLLVNHGFPEMKNPHPFIRFRAVWLFRQFSYMEYHNKDNLYAGLDGALQLLMKDTHLPVRVEAALCLNEVLDNQKAAEDFLRPHAISVLQVALDLVRLTNYEELTEVLQTFVVEFPEQVAPCATELATHLLLTFQNIVHRTDQQNNDDERSSVLTGMSVLQTLELLNDCTVEKPELNAQLAPIVVKVIQIILEHNLSEFYEEMFGLLTSLTSKRISPTLWEGFNVCSQILFKGDVGVDYFSDMVLCLYNYATKDPEGFIGGPDRVKNMCHMCEHVLFNEEAGEDTQCHAAKLLEVIILTYKGQINQFLPAIIELVFKKLFSSQHLMAELKTQLLLVIIAAVYYDPPSVLSFLQAATTPQGESLISKFLSMWLAEIDCMFGIHDRKLAVLGLTLFMQLPATLRMPAIHALAPNFLPASLQLFQGLKRMYTHADTDSEDEWTDDEGEEDVVHTDDEDVKEKPKRQDKMEGEGGDEPEEEEDDDEDDYYSEDYGSETLKQLTTPLDTNAVDEFAIFKQTVLGVQQHDPEWWNVLAMKASETDKNLLQEMLKFADERHNPPPEQPHVKQQ